MNANEILYFVISSIKPYKYDIYRALCLPNELIERTRWRSNWVSPRLQSIHNQLKKKKGLLLLKDVSNNLIYPIRWVEILNTEEVSDIYYYEFILKDLVKYDTNKNVAYKKVLEFNNEMEIRHKDDLYNEDSFKNKYVFSSSIEPKTFDNEGNSELVDWGNIIKTISDIENIKGDEFLKIVKISELNDRNASIEDGRLLLNTKKLYNLNIFQIIPQPQNDPPSPHDIEMFSPGEHISILKQKQSAVGKYDFIKFIFKTNPLIKTESSFIEISAKTESDPNIPSIYIPCKISPKLTAWSILKVLISIICLWFIFFPKLYDIPKEIINNVAIMLFIITINNRLDWINSITSKFNFTKPSDTEPKEI